MTDPDNPLSIHKLLRGMLDMLDPSDGNHGMGVVSGRIEENWCLTHYDHPASEELFKIIHENFGEDAVFIKPNNAGKNIKYIRDDFFDKPDKLALLIQLFDKITLRPTSELITVLFDMIPELLTTKEGKSNKFYKAGVPYRPEWHLYKEDRKIFLYLQADKADFSKLNDVRHAIRKSFNVGDDIIICRVKGQNTPSGDTGIEGVVSRINALFSCSSITINVDYFAHPDKLKQLRTLCAEYKQRAGGQAHG